MSKTLKTNSSQGKISLGRMGPKEKAPRDFSEEDIPCLVEKIFSDFDTDRNNRLNKDEFAKVIRTLVDLVKGDYANTEDIEDIFN